MALTFEQVFAFTAPELAESPNIAVAKEMAEPNVSKSMFGSLYNQALAYYTAHLLTLQAMTVKAGSGDASEYRAGSIVSEKEGDLQRQYGGKQAIINAEVSNPLDKTIYGQQFQDLKKRCIVPISTRFSDGSL